MVASRDRPDDMRDGGTEQRLDEAPLLGACADHSVDTLGREGAVEQGATDEGGIPRAQDPHLSTTLRRLDQVDLQSGIDLWARWTLPSVIADRACTAAWR